MASRGPFKVDCIKRKGLFDYVEAVLPSLPEPKKRQLAVLWKVVEKVLVPKSRGSVSGENKSSVPGVKWSYAPSTNLPSACNSKVDRDSRQKLNEFAKELRSFRTVDMSGIVGSALSKEGRLSDVTSFFSGALKIVTKHLQHDKDSSQSTSKPDTDSLLAQVNTLRQELQLLASSRSVTIVAGSRSGSGTFGVTTVIAVGVVGYGYIWWKGWKISDMMFVTRRGFSDACKSVGKQLDIVSSSVASAKRHLSLRIDCVGNNIDECKELTAATKDEVSRLHGDLSEFHEDVESVRCAVQTLETKLVRIEENQDFATEGVYRLCKFVEKLEPGRNPVLIQDSASCYRQAIGPPQRTTVTQMSSMPPLSLEPPSPSASTELPKVLHTPKVVSTSGLKDLWISNTVERNLRLSSIKPSNGISSVEEPSSTRSASSSSGFGWRLPGLSVLTRSRSTAS